MRSRHLIALAAAATAGLAVPAGPAVASTVSPQAEIRPPARFPVAMPGRFKQGARIPRGHVLLRRSVTIGEREGRLNVTFRCPGGRRVRTIATNDPATIVINIREDQRNYTRRSRLTLFTYAPRALVGAGGTGRGRIYVLCRPR